MHGMCTVGPYLVRVGFVTASEMRRTPATDSVADEALGRSQEREHR